MSRNSRAVLSLIRLAVIWSAVVLASATSSASASLRQQVRSTAPIVFPDSGSLIGTPAQPKTSRSSA